MDSFFNQVFTLLTSDAGSLAYRLILVFSILGAMQITLSINQREQIKAWKRLVFGLATMLFLQLILFVISGLGWQGFIDATQLLPLLDRTVLLLSTLIIVWMWISDNPYQFADISAVILAGLIIIGSIIGLYWWNIQPPETTFNYSVVDDAAQVTNIVLLISGGLLLYFRRPLSWGYGICMLGLIFIGSALYLVLPQIEGNYSGAVRLSLIAAYPFLLYLPQRYSEPEPKEVIRSETILSGPVGDVDQISTDAYFIQSLPPMISETDEHRLFTVMTSLMAQLSKAEICLMAKVIEEEGVVVIEGGFDQSKDLSFERMAIPIQKFPLIVSSFRMGRIRKIKINDSSTDLINLISTLNLQGGGSALLLPVLSSEGLPIALFLLYTSDSIPDWTAEEQAKLHQFAKILVYLLQLSREKNSLREETELTRNMLRLVQDQEQITNLERQKLLDRLSILQAEAGQVPIQALAAGAIFVDEASPSQVSDRRGFMKEGEQRSRLETALDKPVELKLENDLKTALQEIVRLRDDLGAAEGRLSDLQTTLQDSSLDEMKSQRLNDIAVDLNSSISTIIQNNDHLLEDTAGVLDVTQRRYLERIKISTNRISHLVGELVFESSFQPVPVVLLDEELDFSKLIKGIFQEFEADINQHEIHLVWDFPKKSQRIFSNAAFLKEIFWDLLKNAIEVSPNRGEIKIQIRRESAEGKPDFILTQITDSGSGITPQEIMNIFSPTMTSLPISGTISPEIDFASLKRKVISLYGKIWVDSEIGTGSVFNVLLPVIPPVGLDAQAKESEY